MIDSGNRNSDATLLEAESLRRRIAELEQANAAFEAREGRYRDLIENARDMIWTVDLDGAVTFLNSACERIIGYTKDELIGKELSDLIAPENLGAARETLGRRWSQEKNTSFEIRVIAKNGAHVDLEVNSALLEREGAPFGILAIARDISERKRLQEQLQQSSKLEAVGRLAGGVAHDFNNLLTVITGYSQLLLNRVDSEHPMFPGLDHIRQSAEKAAVLTRQLLAFSRKQTLEPVVFDLTALVTDMQKMLRRLIGEHIELVIQPGPESYQVRADAGQLEQVVMNLALNARDAMPDGGTLTIATDRAAYTTQDAGSHAPGDYAVLRVSDTGEAIDNVARSHLFEPFFTTKRHDNSGLGLSAVYGIVEQHGGFVRVSSEPSSGATFEICLPLLIRIEDPTVTGFPKAAPLGGNETILVVEDEDGVLRLIGETLSSYGYNVIECHDSGQALEMAQRNTPRVDLLLTDVVMPKINGRNLADAWRLLHPELKVLFISGYMDHASMSHMLAGLEDDLLQKPFSGVKLAQRIREALDGGAR